MARPKKALSELQSENVTAYFTKGERKIIEAKAKRAGLSISEFCRKAALAKHVKEVDKITPRMLSELKRVGVNLNQIAARINSQGNVKLNTKEYRMFENVESVLTEIKKIFVR